MNGEIRIDAELVTDVIRESFPVLRQSQAKWIGEGYDSVAFEIGGEWVFRFPKRDGVEQQILLEIRLLPSWPAIRPCGCLSTSSKVPLRGASHDTSVDTGRWRVSRASSSTRTRCR